MLRKGIVRAALEAVFAEEGCPICRLLGEREEIWLRSLLTESVNDLGMRNRIAASWGFCHRHAWGIAARTDLGGPLGLAIIYESLAGRLLARCEADGENGQHQPQATGHADCLEAARPGHACLYCAAQARVERNYIISFVKYCAQPHFAQRYERSGGFCLQHLWQALGVARPSVRLWLLQVELAKLEGTLQAVLSPADMGWGVMDPLGAMRPRLFLLAGAYPFYPRSRDYYRYARALGRWGRAKEEREATACPLCLAERETERQQLLSFLQPDHDGQQPAPWLCPVHAWQLQALAAEQRRFETYVSWTSGLIRATMNALAELLQAEQSRPHGHDLLAWLYPVRPALPFPHGECAICAAKTRAGEMARDQAACSIHDKTMRDDRALEWPRVCFQHLPGLLAAASPVAAQALRIKQLARLSALRAELETYIHKVHWNYKGEPWGPERDSWRRAVDLFVGGE